MALLEQAVLQDLLSPQGVAAVDQGDLAGEVGEEDRLLDRRVAAADDGDLLAAIEEAVAGGAGRHAEAAELGLAGQPKPAGLRAGGDDQGVAGIDRAGIAAMQRNGRSREVDLDDEIIDQRRCPRGRPEPSSAPSARGLG